MEPKEKNKGGRPAGRRWPHRVWHFESQEGIERLKRLEERLDASQSAVIRRAIEELARREGVE